MPRGRPKGSLNKPHPEWDGIMKSAGSKTEGKKPTTKATITEKNTSVKTTEKKTVKKKEKQKAAASSSNTSTTDPSSKAAKMMKSSEAKSSKATTSAATSRSKKKKDEDRTATKEENLMPDSSTEVLFRKRDIEQVEKPAEAPPPAKRQHLERDKRDKTSESLDDTEPSGISRDENQSTEADLLARTSLEDAAIATEQAPPDNESTTTATLSAVAASDTSQPTNRLADEDSISSLSTAPSSPEASELDEAPEVRQDRGTNNTQTVRLSILNTPFSAPNNAAADWPFAEADSMELFDRDDTVNTASPHTHDSVFPLADDPSRNSTPEESVLNTPDYQYWADSTLTARYELMNRVFSYQTDWDFDEMSGPQIYGLATLAKDLLTRAVKGDKRATASETLLSHSQARNTAYEEQIATLTEENEKHKSEATNMRELAKKWKTELVHNTAIQLRLKITDLLIQAMKTGRVDKVIYIHAYCSTPEVAAATLSVQGNARSTDWDRMRCFTLDMFEKVFGKVPAVYIGGNRLFIDGAVLFKFVPGEQRMHVKTTFDVVRGRSMLESGFDRMVREVKKRQEREREEVETRAAVAIFAESGYLQGEDSRSPPSPTRKKMTDGKARSRDNSGTAASKENEGITTAKKKSNKGDDKRSPSTSKKSKKKDMEKKSPGSNSASSSNSSSDGEKPKKKKTSAPAASTTKKTSKDKVTKKNSTTAKDKNSSQDLEDGDFNPSSSDSSNPSSSSAANEE